MFKRLAYCITKIAHKLASVKRSSYILNMPYHMPTHMPREYTLEWHMGWHVVL